MTLIAAVFTVSLFTVNTFAVSNPISIVNPTQEKSTGTIVEVNSNGGKLIDDKTGETRDFFHPGAQIDFKKGEVIMFLKISLPNGKVIVKEVQKKNS